MIVKPVWMICFYASFIANLWLPLAYAATSDGVLSRSETPISERQETGKLVIHYDMVRLPQAVFKTRQRIMEAAKTGEIENLRPLLTQFDMPTQVQFNEQKGDPIAFLKDISGDGEGFEILAILLELLQSGYVIVDEEGTQELYVWPYFVALPLGELDKTQMVEVYQIMTANDFDVMREIGTYTFFRLGISRDGHWRFFLSGN